MDTNTVVLIGRLVRDVELKYTAAGMAIGTGTIAQDRSVKKNGEWEKESYFFDFSSFGKQVEALKPYLLKGKQIAITGYLKQDKWTDQQTGQNRTKIGIVANNIQLVGGRSDGQNQQQNSYGAGEDFPEDIPYGND